MPTDTAKDTRVLIAHIPEDALAAATPGEIGKLAWPKLRPEKAARRAGRVLWHLERNECVKAAPLLFSRVYWLTPKGVVWRKHFTAAIQEEAAHAT